MNRLTRISLVALLLMVAATPALADIGFHAGASIDPDDFLFGVRFSSTPIEEAILIVPSVEVGFGDVTMVAGNLDLHWMIPTEHKLAPYVGGGITLNWFDFEGESDTEFGGSILGGISLTPKFFFEAKLGLGDVPDAKLVIGWNR